jgi:hypothetical protein
MVVVTMLAMAAPAAAQHQHGASPYAGMQQRPVKALSDQQIADLRAGRGMGLALPGELNGYPGPAHVLELADKLELTGEQRERVQQLFEMMKAEAIPVGERLIEQESALDREFAERKIAPASLASLTAQIGETQGQLRAVHLKYHLTTAELLSNHQRHRYAELRGYR